MQRFAVQLNTSRHSRVVDQRGVTQPRPYCTQRWSRSGHAASGKSAAPLRCLSSALMS
jgi:hypothetical protein